MAKDTYFKRYIILIKRLLQSPANLEELKRCLRLQSGDDDQELEVSQRTLQRDFIAIYNLFGYEITNERKGDRRYLIKDRDNIKEYSQRLLESFELTDIISSSQRFINTVFLESRQPKGLEHFHGLIHAINNKYIVTFVHHKYWEEDETKRKVHPLGLKEAKGRWYLIAIDTKDRKAKTFGLDRIEQLEISNTQFREKYPIDLKNAFTHSFGIMNLENKEDPQLVRLAFTYKEGQYVKAYPLHHSQKVISEGDPTIIELKIFISYDFIQELLSFGEEVKILEPVSLVEEVKEKLKKALIQYDDKTFKDAKMKF